MGNPDQANADADEFGDACDNCDNLVNNQGWFYIGFYTLLIIFFAYFYTAIAFNPAQQADIIRKQGGFIPGVRPGPPTERYLAKVLNRITLPGSLFLAAIGCLAPLGGVLMVLVGPQALYAGGLSLMAGLLGLACGRLPGAAVRWGVVWWAIIAVGQWPLFRMPLHTVFFLLMVLVLVVTPPSAAIPTLLATVAVAGSGFGLGVLIRRRAATITD